MNRLLSAACVLLVLEGAARCGVASGKRPNVVFVLADDLGWSDLGCYGADLHETPNLDRLAGEGVRFTRTYAMSVCSPTRAAILTGRHPARLHMTIWREGALAAQQRNAPPRQKLLPPAPQADLPRSATTLAEMLQSLGYRTFHVGKWHLGAAEDYPETHGFDVNVGGTLWGAPKTYFWPFRGPTRQEYRYVPGLGVGKPADYLPDRLTDEALKLIDSAADKPFFLHLCYHAPHTPIEGKPELVRRYQGKVMPGFRHKNASYAAMIHSLDQNVGRVLERLTERKLADNTLVIFTSDNGGHIGTYDGQQVTDNHPLRSGKGSLYEGGIRVPLIVRWPGVVPVGSRCDEPTLCTDFWPTIAEAVRYTPDRKAVPPDGVSLLPLFRKPTAKLERTEMYFHYPHYYPTTTPVSAVRSGDWKLLEYFEDRRTELYNLAADPSERNNLAEAEPARAKAMRRKLTDWRREVKAQIPEANPGFRPTSRGCSSPANEHR